MRSPRITHSAPSFIFLSSPPPHCDERLSVRRVRLIPKPLDFEPVVIDDDIRNKCRVPEIVGRRHRPLCG